MLSKEKYTLDKIFRTFMNLCMLVGVILLLSYLSDVLIPFAIAALIAYLLQPIVSVISKYIKNRFAAIFLSLFSVILVFSVVGFICIPIVTAEATHLGGMVKELAGNSELAKKAAERLPADLWIYLKDLYKTIDTQKLVQSVVLTKASQWLFSNSFTGVQGILTTTKILLGIIFGILVVFLYLVFILSDYQRLREGWSKLLPESIRDSCVEFVQEFDFQMNRYFRAQLLVAMLIGVLFAIGFSIISLPLGIMLGIFIGLLNMIPYFQVVGLVPAALLALTKALDTGDSFTSVLIQIIIIFVVVQVIQDVLIVPKIMGEVTGFSPAVILLSISVWGKILGILGIIIAIPATCLFFTYYKRIIVKEQANGSG